MDTSLTIFYILLLVFQFLCLWIVYQKADKPGWGCIIPIYNIVLLCDIAKISRWWTVGMFIPLVWFVAWALLTFNVARNFGQSLLFGFGLFFLPIIFYAVLAFGSSSYQRQTM